MRLMNNLADPSEAHRRIPWLLPLFFGSGCAALIYEVVWLQLLQLVIGLTSVSLGILLGVFMGGMCLGSLGFPRLVNRRIHPLKAYAMLEIGIALIAVAALFLLPWLSQLYAAVGGRGFRGTICRGGLAALCLLPPAALMGATLPALARWTDTSRRGIAWLGFFYGGNIVGAVGGCLLAGFYLLRVHDMATATYVAAGINGLVAAMAWLLALGSRYEAPKVQAQPEPTRPTPGGQAVYWAIGLSGMTALGAEVVWTRLLSLTLGGTVYTFSIILAVMLAGLGVGSTVGAALARNMNNPGRALGMCQLGITLGVAWAALMMSHSLPYWPVNPALSISPWYTFQLDLVRCLWVLWPAACLWGAAFPLALAARGAGGQDPGRLVGKVYAANTVGAISGALVFSLVVLPMLGSQAAQRILVFLAAAAALCAFAQSHEPGGRVKPWWRWAGAMGVLLVAAGLAWSVSAAPWGLVAYGRHMATWVDRLEPGITPESDVPSGSPTRDVFCTYLGEGVNGSVAVTQWSSGVRDFHSAGKVQASTDPQDMRLQRMLGHLSALAHPRPESVLVVACGAGVTAGTFVVHPSVKRIVICDIEPLVPRRVAPMFAKENHGVVQDPRTEIVADDGRHFLRTTQEQFDIITSDPIDPWVKGCAALNTVEYYELCKARLKPGGVMSLWLPLYESNRATAKSLIGTFFKAFPDGVLFSNDADGEGYDAVLLGKVGPVTFDLEQLSGRMEGEDHARVRASLREAGFNSLVSLLATYAAQPSGLDSWLQDAQINTDANLRLQYLAGFSLNTSESSEILEEIRWFRKFPAQVFVGSSRHTKFLRYAIEGLPADETVP